MSDRDNSGLYRFHCICEKSGFIIGSCYDNFVKLIFCHKYQIDIRYVEIELLYINRFLRLTVS